jgi:predicted tellurium resistance membrane protein TerC
MDWAGDPQIWAALLTLTTLEIVLGIDNLIFVAVLANRLPSQRQASARRLGLALALVTRLALLASVAWLASLTAPVIEGFGHALSWRDLILIVGGLFLVSSGTREIHGQIEGDAPNDSPGTASAGFAGVVTQIVLLDIVFSLDSVITAVGMASQFWVMAAAIVIAAAVMLVAAAPVSGFIHRYPTVKVLAFSFLLLIGTTLVADGAGFHIPRSYIYAAIGFSLGVEGLNQFAARRRGRPADPARGRVIVQVAPSESPNPQRKEQPMEDHEHRPHVTPVCIDTAIEECIVSRRNFYLGLWAGRQLGIAEERLGEYAHSVVAADYEEPGPEDVIRKLARDFAANNLVVTREEVELQLCRIRAIAARQFAVSG